MVNRWRRVIGRWAGTVSSNGAVRTGQHPSVGELRQPRLETLVEPETTRLHQPQSRDRRDRLGHRLDPHDGVVAHGIPVDRGDAGGNHFGVAAPAQGDGARHGPGLDMADQKPFQFRNHVSGGGRAGRWSSWRHSPAFAERRPPGRSIGLEHHAGRDVDRDSTSSRSCVWPCSGKSRSPSPTTTG